MRAAGIRAELIHARLVKALRDGLTPEQVADMIDVSGSLVDDIEAILHPAPLDLAAIKRNGGPVRLRVVQS